MDPALAAPKQAGNSPAESTSGVQVAPVSAEFSTDLKVQQVRQQDRLDYFERRLEDQNKHNKELLDGQDKVFIRLIDGLDSRIVDLQLGIALFGVLMTVTAIYFSFNAKREAVLQAKKAASDEINKKAIPMVEDWIRKNGESLLIDWINKNGPPLLVEKIDSTLKPETQKAIEEIKSTANELLNDLKEEKNKTKGLIDELEQFRKDQVAKFTEMYTRYVEIDKPLSEKARQIVDGVANDLKSKAPKEYTYDDWFVLGVEASDSQKFEIAADHFTKSAELTNSPVRQAQALINKGGCLGALQRGEEAIAIFEAVAQRFSDATGPLLREMVAKALVNKGLTFRALKRHVEAIVVYDGVVHRFSEATEPELRELVASALLYKGIELNILERVEDEIAVYNEVVQRFGDAIEPEVREIVASALQLKGLTISIRALRSEDVIDVYDEIVRRFGEATEPKLREIVAWALKDKGKTLGSRNRNDEAITVDKEVARRFGEATDPAVMEIVEQTHNGIGCSLLMNAKVIWWRGDEEAARKLLTTSLEMIELALEYRPDEPRYLANQGYVYYLLGKPEKALPILTKAIALVGKDMRQELIPDACVYPVPQDEEFKKIIEGI